MGFAIPAALLALAFVAGPIVAHLVRRRGVDVRTLPTVRYLQKALSASSRKRRLIDLLLLAVRILAVVALALTAAQPFRALPEGSLGALAVSATFVVDDSHSMRARKGGDALVDLAIDRALADLAALPEGSSVSVIAAGAPPRVLVRRTRARDLAEAALRSLRGGSSRGGALVPALEQAHGTFEPGLDRHLFVYSDFAAHAAGEPPSFPPGARVHLEVLRPEATHNRRIVDARVRPLDADGEDLAVDVFVRSDESERARFEIGLREAGKILAREVGTFDEGGEGRVSLTVRAEAAGDVVEAVILDGDDLLPEDDVRPVLTRDEAHTRVLVVDGRPRPQLLDSAAGFFRAALRNAPARDGRFAVRLVDDEGLDERAIEEADVIVYADVHAPDPARFARVLAQVERGRGLLVALGEASDPFAYAGLLGAAAPARILAASEGAKLGAESEILDQDLGNLRATKHFPLEPASDATVLLRLAGTPLAVERAYGSGTVVLLGVPLDDTLSNFPYLPAYLPTMVAMVSRLAPPSLGRGVFTAGEAVALEPFFRERDELWVETPAGRRVTVRRAEPRFVDTGEAGLHRVLEAGAPRASFVVVPPVEETALGEGPVPEPPAAREGRAAGDTARADLTPLFAFLAALLLAIEGFIRTRAAGAQARTETTTRGIPPKSDTARVSR